MNWFTWEQHKKQFLIAGIFLALFAAFMIPTGISFWHAYQRALSTCSQTNTCGQLSSSLFQSSTNQLVFNDLVPDAMLFLPVIFGMFWGVPLLAKEYAEGTNKLVWTRSISRRKWLTVKLVWMLLSTALLVGAFAALTTWWSRTLNDLVANRFAIPYFNIQGIVPVAYGLFAVALGIMFGAWFRRTLVALGVTLALSVVVILVIVPNFVRQQYMMPFTTTASMSQGALDSKIPRGAWIVSRGFIDQRGRASSTPFDLPDWPSQCQALARDQQAPVVGAPKVAPSDIDHCLTAAGYRQTAKYQPSYRYWDFQWIESGIYLGVTALTVGATYWLVLKRDA